MAFMTTQQREERRTNLVHLAGVGVLVGVLTGAVGLDAMAALATATFVFLIIKAVQA